MAYCNIKENKESQFPIRLLKFVLNKLKIKDLFKKFVKDPRSGPDYSIDSLLMFCLCNHLFRMPSKNKFHLNFKRMTAAKAIAKFCGFDVDRSPCARTTDDLLQHLNPEDFSSILPAIFRNLCRHKVFQLHPELIPLKEFAVTIDAQATRTYHDQSQHPCKCQQFPLTHKALV